MKIVHVNNSDFNGGASIAVRRLHKQMLEMNYDSHLVVNEMIYGEKNTHTIHKTSEVIKSLVKKGWNRKIKYFFNKDVQYSCSYNLIPSDVAELQNIKGHDEIFREQLEKSNSVIFPSKVP